MSIQQIAFIAVLGLSLGLAWQRFGRIRRNIQLGKAEAIGGQSAERWRNVLLVAFGQQKMFSNWIPAVLHLFIYAAFLLTQVELLEIIVDGLTGSHRFFAPMLGGFYTFLISFIEILSLLALVATFAFLARRNLLKVPRFQKPELNGWPRLDGNLILYGEILLIAGIFSMNGADAVLQDLGAAGYPATGDFAPLLPMLKSKHEARIAEDQEFQWWMQDVAEYRSLRERKTLDLPLSENSGSDESVYESGTAD